MATPAPPPGFELINDAPQQTSTPAPPPGFELIDEKPVHKDYDGWGEYLRDLARTAAQGATLGFGDEITAGVRALAGTPYDQAIKEEREAIDRFTEKNPVTAIGSQLATGFALPAGPAMWALKAPSMVGKIARSAAVGSGFGGIAGIGAGQETTENRLLSGLAGAGAGAVVGAALPPVASTVSAAGRKVSDALSPTFARMGANANRLFDKLAIRASVEAPPPVNPGADAAAEQIIANQLMRAGRSADDLQGVLNQAGENARFYSNSRAQEKLAPVDLDPSLQRLAGSVVRNSPDAGNLADAFIYGRQTGITPTRGNIPKSADIPTRPELAQPQAGDAPMGQGERLMDALKRAFNIKDNEFHGHGKNAYRTEQDILQRASDEAKTLYGNAYDAGNGVDLRPTIQPILQKWADAAANEPGPVGREIERAIKLFTTRRGELVPDLRRFDKSKQYLDGVIDKMFNGQNANRYLGGVMTQLKNELLGAVDQLPSMGAAYQKARNAYSSHMEMRDALKLGLDSFRQDSGVAADMFHALPEGQQKMFRLGLLAGFQRRAAEMKATADKTQLFDNDRIREILRAAIPRPKKASAEFADRPERFGGFLNDEKSMIGTRNVVQGNSMTARNLADDEAYNGMARLGETWNKIKSSGSVAGLTINAAEAALNKLFGMRADTAAAVAQKLFTANPLERATLIDHLSRRMGRTRFEHFTQLMEQYQAQLQSPGAAAAGLAGGGQ